MQPAGYGSLNACGLENRCIAITSYPVLATSQLLGHPDETDSHSPAYSRLQALSATLQNIHRYSGHI